MKIEYQEKFIEFKEQLSSFLYRLLTNKQDVEDIIQDTYIQVFDKIETFKNTSSFKTWVFTIALNKARNHLTKLKRWSENTQDYGANLHEQSTELWDKMVSVFETTPDKQYEVKEHPTYCFNCINKTLKIEQQTCLLLKEVHNFKVHEIIKITGLSEGKVKHAIADARKNMIRIFDNRCSFVNKKGVCHQCTTLTGMLNKKQNTEEQLNKLRLIQENNNPDKEYLLNLRIEIVKSINPLNAPNFNMHNYMLSSAEKWVEMGKEKKVLETRPKSFATLSKA